MRNVMLARAEACNGRFARNRQLTERYFARYKGPVRKQRARFHVPQNLFQLRDTYETAPGPTRQVTHDTLTLRADRWFNLCPQWQLALRMDLPFVAKNAISSENPEGDFIYGLGDAYTQAALIRTFDPRWAAGIGLRLITPTGQETLTSDKWRLMPQVRANGPLLSAIRRHDRAKTDEKFDHLLGSRCANHQGLPCL